MKIPFAGLGEGKHEFFFTEQPSVLELEAEFSEVAVRVDAEKTPSEVFFRAVVTADRRCICDRCLMEFIKPVSASYVVHYVTDDANAAAFDPAETQVVSPSLPAITIDEDVRQTLQVAVPLKLLCEEQCKGLCPRCGKNLNEGPCSCEPDDPDSRWEALEQLKRHIADPDNEK